jgi:A/G-specific adenine glycosylase
VIAWFERAGRDLPWRRPDRTPWGVLVSEVMLQQTPVARVLGPWQAWLARWSTPRALAEAAPADVLRAWGRLGYPRRALRLHEAAGAIVRAHGGRVPDDEATLRHLPGLGAYTAAAVAAFAFGRRTVVLDTNVRRVLGRAVAGVALPPPAPRAAERSLAQAVLPVDAPASVAWNAGAMELGALVCTARGPACDACPLAERCAWLAAGRPADPWADRRRVQPWHGTDRQVRGRLMAALREAPDGIGLEAARSLAADQAQADRAIAGLVADGLAATTGQRLHLPA